MTFCAIELNVPANTSGTKRLDEKIEMRRREIAEKMRKR